jgi:hypothetical protein
VFPNPGQVPHWQKAAAGEPVDWDAAFDGYQAQVDWPGAHVWRELAAHYPDAKVIHSERPDDSWWKSFSGTIGKAMQMGPRREGPQHIQAMSAAVAEMVAQQTFGGRFADREAALAAYHRRRADVIAAIPAERLLIFDVVQGWEPLCTFLDVPVPDTPFPRTNDREAFWARFGGEPA